MDERPASVTTQVSYKTKRIRVPVLFFIGWLSNLVVVYLLLTGTFPRQIFGPAAMFAAFTLVGGVVALRHRALKEPLWDKDTFLNPALGLMFGGIAVLMIYLLQAGRQPAPNSQVSAPVQSAPFPAERWRSKEELNSKPTSNSDMDAQLAKQHKELAKALEAQKKGK